MLTVKRKRVLMAGGAAAVLALALFLGFRGRNSGIRFATAMIDRGDIAEVVGATGVLEAVTTVQVGSQVSGTIANLYADFNSVVKKDQVIARLDPSLFQARVAQAQANLVAARASVERSRAQIDDAKQKYERAKELAAQQLIAPSDLDTAKATYDEAVAQNRADVASVKQSESALSQAQLDLDHSVIRAPIDGVVLARNVDAGQTVAASFQAPVLFVIANDLTRMQVNASVDEADIGGVKPGLDVTFRVDAYPDDTFAGKVQQVRLQPVTNQNVVTYNTIIIVDNKDLRLMPGMTATVSVIIHQSENALRLPTPALRFRPEGFEEKRPLRAAEGSPTPAVGPATRLAPAPAQGRPGSGAASVSRRHEAPGRPGLVFSLGPDGQPKPTPVRLGISDGRYTEVLSGLEEGTRIVTGVEAPGTTARAGASPSANNPFSPGRPQPRTR